MSGVENDHQEGFTFVHPSSEGTIAGLFLSGLLALTSAVMYFFTQGSLHETGKWMWVVVVLLLIIVIVGYLGRARYTINEKGIERISLQWGRRIFIPYEEVIATNYEELEKGGVLFRIEGVNDTIELIPGATKDFDDVVAYIQEHVYSAKYPGENEEE